MLSGIRKRFTYANVAVTLALVFAMSGGAYAASRYVITSAKQISPKVLKTLKGKAGPAGASGAQGPAGVAGPAGAQGPTGPKGETGKEGAPGKNGGNGKNGTTGFTETLPEGKTEKGDWTAGVESASVGIMLSSVSFDIPLQSAPAPIYVKAKAATPEHCTGSVEAPGAEAGYLCVFASAESGVLPEAEVGVNNPKICAPASKEDRVVEVCARGSSPAMADPTGFALTVYAEQGGFATGTWAVTAE